MQKKLSLLAEIAKEFNEKHIRWQVGASLMLYLRGVAGHFNDLDLFVDEHCLEEAKAVLLRRGRMLPRTPDANFRTKHFLEFEIGGTEVDLLAGFTVLKDGVEHSFPLEEGCDRLSLLGEEIPLQSLGRWRECYAAMDREAKVKMIDKAIAKRSHPWLDWAIELQSIAQNGLTYAKDIYDIERYTRLREISAEMIAHQGEIPLERTKTLFCSDSGYQTPKIDTRAAIFQDHKILLVLENNGKWSLPGGWVDADESIASNTIKEVWEEAGLRVSCERLIAVQDRKRHNLPIYAWNICKVFMLCRLLGGKFVPNSETTASGFFALDELPPLAEEKNTPEQLAMCFAANQDPNWKVQFD